MVGRALCETLVGQGHDVVKLVRRPVRTGEVGAIAWDPAAGAIDAAGLEGLDGVVHLAGAGIADHRWTPSQKAAILDSRVQGTGLLARTLAGLASPPPVMLSGSAIGIYGTRDDEMLTERSPAGDGFLADVVEQWEAASQPAAEAGIRTVNLRTGIVLSRRGGALKKQLLPFKLGLGGRVGSGRQWMSWITIDDEIAAIVHLLGADGVSGPVNLTAPQPVTQIDFARTLGRVLHRPTVLPTPVFLVKAALGADLVDELLLASQRVSSTELIDSGFVFAHPDLETGLRAMVGRGAGRPRE
jgi:uncharacterized protein (TIGR01777 family)